MGRRLDTPLVYAAFFALVGGLLVVIALYLAAVQPPDPVTWRRVWLEFLQTVGISLVIAGVLSIFLDTRHWRSYFQTALREIVVQQDYLDQLSVEELSNLQVQTLKALYRTPDVDREGSFLEHFQKGMQGFIKEPYREDCVSEVILLRTEKGLWLVADSVSYVCRQVGGVIQARVRWAPDKGEFASVDALEVELQLPEAVEGSGNVLKFDRQTLSKIPDVEHGYGLDLQPWIGTDRLRVTIRARYWVTTHRFQTWQMAHPTRGITLLVKYPEDRVGLQYNTFLESVRAIRVNEEAGYFSLVYNSWVLPSFGVAWNIYTKE
jgi:hypothetical protein